MKKLEIFFIFLLLIFCTNFTLAQNWNLINDSLTYNYSGNQIGYISHQLWIDSLDNHPQGELLYFNRIAGPVDSIPSNYPYYVYGDTVYTDNYPQFLMKEAVQTDDYLWMRDTTEMVIYPKSDLNDTWIFDTLNNLSAQVISVNQENVFGQQDSVKLILVGNDSIKISKSFGILSFPDFSNGNVPYKLIGIEGASQPYGYQRPGLEDIYNIPVGFRKKFGYGESDPGGSDQYYVDMEYLEVDQYPDRIEFKIERGFYPCCNYIMNFCYCPPDGWALTYYDTINTVIYLDSLHSAIGNLNQLYPTASFNDDDFEFYYFNTGYYYYGYGYNILKTTYNSDFGILFGSGNNMANYQMYDAYHCTKVQDTTYGYYGGIGSDGHYVTNQYSEKYGLIIYDETSFENDRRINLINWTDSTGSWVNDVEVEDSKEPGISIYPNPADNKLYIEGDISGRIGYAIINIHGQIIKQGEYSNSISINSLPPGIYTLWIRDDQKSKFLKFVKQ
jgi:hypothetical protein